MTPAGGPRTTDTSSQRCPSLRLPLRRRPKAALLPDHRTLRVLPESSSPGIRKGIASLPSGLRFLQIPLLSTAHLKENGTSLHGSLLLRPPPLALLGSPPTAPFPYFLCPNISQP